MDPSGFPIHSAKYIPMQSQPPTIVTQPGFAAPPGSVILAMPEPMPGVPTGLEYMTCLDTIIVHQKKDLLEIAVGWETKNRYVLQNGNGEQSYFAFEESGCCARQCCGPQRGFVMHVVDNFKREVLTIRREFKCCGGCCCGCLAIFGCCQSECVIETQSDGVIGVVRQRPSCMSSCFDVLDGTGNVVFKIDGPCCIWLYGCQDKKFPISTLSSQKIGAITKKWGGCFKEAYTNADTFAVTFPIDLDVKLKGVLLGATFLIDFMEFEQPKEKDSS